MPRRDRISYMTTTTRRDLLVAMGTVAGAARLRAAGGRPIRFGGPVFLKSDDPEQLAQEHRRLGYSAAQCPAKVTAADTDRVRAIEKAFAAHNVVIAEVGAWKNMLDPDEQKRKENLQ